VDFGLSDDQKLLEKTVRGFLGNEVPIARVRELRERDCPSDRGVWKQLAELGMTGILIPEEQGGSALGLLDAALVAQSLGYSATPAPYLTSAVMVPVALRALARAETDAWLAGIASGDLVFGVAVTESFSVREGAGVSLEGGSLRGKALMALDALAADFVLVALANGGLAVVSGDAPGLAKTRLATIDRTRDTAELVFDGVAPEAVFEAAGAALARMLDAGRIALAADTLGACESMIAQAVAYSLQRKQFDRLIGSFQAVKHMCAEMIAELEPARSLLWYAAHSFDALPAEAPQMACHVLAHVSEIGREIASVATQVHGGIGWTDEQNLHLWFKRIGVARHLLGGPELLRSRAAALQGLAA
jgi:alkylation response protein AidB-like acyl-CoA dehydrogenase